MKSLTINEADVVSIEIRGPILKIDNSYDGKEFAPTRSRRLYFTGNVDLGPILFNEFMDDEGPTPRDRADFTFYEDGRYSIKWHIHNRSHHAKLTAEIFLVVDYTSGHRIFSTQLMTIPISHNRHTYDQHAQGVTNLVSGVLQSNFDTILRSDVQASFYFTYRG